MLAVRVLLAFVLGGCVRYCAAWWLLVVDLVFGDGLWLRVEDACC